MTTAAAAAWPTAEPAVVRQRPVGPIVLSIALGLTACVQPPPPPPPSGPSVEQRVRDLEGRLDALERYVTAVPAVPLRSRAEIEADIRSLESQRAQLLMHYQPAHPDIRDIDFRLRLLRGQLQMLDRTAAPTK